MQGLWWVRVGEQENNDTVRLWVKMLQDKGPISGCNTQGPSFRTECGATFDHCTVGEFRLFCPMGVLGVFI